MRPVLIFLLGSIFCSGSSAQSYYYGADLSYVNEMEDCGAQFFENNIQKDPFEIFNDHNCNLVRFRLWHTPSWYDGLNTGNRYSDLNDVKKGLQRAKSLGMKTLLNFHLSDNWADPGKQIIPAAWEHIVDDLDILNDSLYLYVYETLFQLFQEELLPDIIQIGNETNRGILLSQEVNDSGWVLDWDRNSELFNTALRAVKNIEETFLVDVDIALHFAGPDETTWYVENFVANGVVDFDIIGISYYHQWHGAVNFQELGELISNLRTDHGYEVMIFEAGYPWTDSNNDPAGNILSLASTNYEPLSPENQLNWLNDLNDVVESNGGLGVIYWEPAWVSTPCFTQWGQGSHYENATFFDFNNNLIIEGGINWMSKSTAIQDDDEIVNQDSPLEIVVEGNELWVKIPEADVHKPFHLSIIDSSGTNIQHTRIQPDYSSFSVNLGGLSNGLYFVQIRIEKNIVLTQSFLIQR